MFFDGGIVSDEVLAKQLLECARSLGAKSACLVEVGNWQLVGSETDWFALTRFQIPETLVPPWPTPVPEWGQNCTRPEMLISLLAQDILMKKNDAISVLKVSSASSEEPLRVLEQATHWRRAIAFRGAAIEA